MIISLVLLATAWTWAACAADPAPARTAAPCVCYICGLECHCPTRGKCQERPHPKPQPPAQPKLYQLTDRFGQAWRHADPNYLRFWVDQRNATVFVLPFAGGCAGGRCGR